MLSAMTDAGMIDAMDPTTVAVMTAAGTMTTALATTVTTMIVTTAGVEMDRIAKETLIQSSSVIPPRIPPLRGDGHAGIQ